MLRTLSLATLGLAALAAGPAFAMDPETLVVHVPFAFTVRNATLPAGDYSVRPLSDLARNVLEIRSVDGRHCAFVLTSDAPGEHRGAPPQLVFDRYGDKDFLRAVELPEEPGAALPATRSEIRAARDLASPHKGQRGAGS
jgi:hypothetical protein